MGQIVVSTVGTSLLTNQIDRANPDEKSWYAQLRDTANLKLDEIPQTVAAEGVTKEPRMPTGSAP
jgi:hypothetical protein